MHSFLSDRSALQLRVRTSHLLYLFVYSSVHLKQYHLQQYTKYSYGETSHCENILYYCLVHLSNDWL